MNKVFLFVEIDVKPGMRDDFLVEISKHGAHIRTEDGCEVLNIFLDTDSTDRVCVWEIWSDRHSWDLHMANEASRAWQKIAINYVVTEKIIAMDSV